MTITFKAQLTEDVINKVIKITIGKKVHKYVVINYLFWVALVPIRFTRLATCVQNYFWQKNNFPQKSCSRRRY